MKKILCVVLALAMALVIPFSVSASSSEIEILSDLSDEKLIEFLKEREVSIPEKFEDEIDWAPFIRGIIECVEENPNVTFAFGYTVPLLFAEDIKTAVNEYYGTSNVSTFAQKSSSNILQDNTVYGSWSSSYSNYNCYGYAIGYYDLIDPGMIKWIDNGNTKESYIYNDVANIYTIAEWVKTDLESLGYTVSKFTTTLPSTDVTSHTNLICIRKDLDGIYYYGAILYDYHFMRLGMDGNWYHKPSTTNPLKYKYVPSNDRVWTNEGYDGVEKQYFRYDEHTYDSVIHYIEYTTPHTWAYVYCGTTDGVHMHISTCTICGATTGSKAACMYKSGSDNCLTCGHSKSSTVTSVSEIAPE